YFINGIDLILEANTKNKDFYSIFFFVQSFSLDIKHIKLSENIIKFLFIYYHITNQIKVKGIF
ncbi:hypothetical protein ACXWOS_10120, partial [Streptococcus pyogenes]